VAEVVEFGSEEEGGIEIFETKRFINMISFF